MDVIPVIDVRHGGAVRAVAGDRANYRPLATPLAIGSDPVVVAEGIIAFHRFPVIYVADLDGIEGRGANARLAHDIGQACPDIGLWLDAGCSTQDGVAATLAAGRRVSAVIGSETGIDVAGLERLVTVYRERIVLSLDFRGGAFIGDPEVLARVDAWPLRVIAMTLGRVGTLAGPDIETISDVIARAKGRRVYGAGGVRGPGDLAAVCQTGSAGVLVASALHAQTITAGDLEGFRPYQV